MPGKRFVRASLALSVIDDPLALDGLNIGVNEGPRANAGSMALMSAGLNHESAAGVTGAVC